MPKGFDELLRGLEANVAIVGQDLCDDGHRLRANVLRIHEYRTSMVRRCGLDEFSSKVTNEAQLVIAERDAWFKQVFKLPQPDA